MTKKELIELLAPYPDNMIVVKPGHSDSNGGFDDIFGAKEIVIVREINPLYWEGKYYPTCNSNKGKPQIQAVAIS